LAKFGKQDFWQNLASKIFGKIWQARFLAKFGKQDFWQNLASKIFGKINVILPGATNGPRWVQLKKGNIRMLDPLPFKVRW